MKRRSLLLELLSQVLVTCAVSLYFGESSGFAQSKGTTASEFAELKAELKNIKADLEEVKRELKLISELLSQRSPDTNVALRAPVSVAIAGNPSLGRQEAPVTLIEFSDYQCPFCKRFFQNTLPRLKDEYISPGKIRYVFRDFPIDQIHPNARKAAEAAHCAGDQGKYWEMHDLLFENQQSLEVESLKAYALTLSLDSAAFDDCLKKDKYAANVQNDFVDGVVAGVRATPSFFIGKTTAENTIQGILISGAQPISIFLKEIERLLREN